MTVSHDDLQRSLGRVEGNQRAMEQRMDRFEKLISEGFSRLEKRLADIESRESERKGMMIVIAAIAAFFSAILTGALAAWIKGWFS